VAGNMAQFAESFVMNICRKCYITRVLYFKAA